MAPQINRFHRVTMGSEFGDIEQATRARLLSDDAALYVAFVSRDTDMWPCSLKKTIPMATDGTTSSRR